MIGKVADVSDKIMLKIKEFGMRCDSMRIAFQGAPNLARGRGSRHVSAMTTGVLS
jgi:hypothetical protein